MAESVSKNSLSAVPEGHYKEQKNSTSKKNFKSLNNQTSTSSLSTKSAKKHNSLSLRSSRTRKTNSKNSSDTQSTSTLVNTDHELHALEKRPKLNSSPGDCIASRTRSHFIEHTSKSTTIIQNSSNKLNTSIASRTRSRDSLTPKASQKYNISQASTSTAPQQIKEPSESSSSVSLSTHKFKKLSKSLRKRKLSSDSDHSDIKKKSTNSANLKKYINLGARLVRSNDGGSSSGVEESGYVNTLGGETSSHLYNHQTNYTPPSTSSLASSGSSNILRRSSRSKRSNLNLTTGSCVSKSSQQQQQPTLRTSNRHQNKSSLNTTLDSEKPSTSSSGDFKMATDDRSGGLSSNQNNLDKSRNNAPNSNDVRPSQLHAGQSSHTGNANLESSSSANLLPTSSAAQPDSESDDNEVGRLQALLEARGLPPHLFGALGPRMHHILNRTIGTNCSTKAQNLLVGLQSADESQQLQSAIEMCQILVMGNEDTLSGFPIKQVVPALITLLRMEHNFDIMNNACRALAYMLEALPRSSLTVVDAIPVFLEKLQVIQCMDVAEQSLTALEILSRRHNKAILQANGVSACLTYLDFFSINAQRAALAITANCCSNIHSEEFHFVRDSLPLLARLLAQQDKKCVESVCTAFTRLVDSFQNESQKLQEIASMDLLKNCQQLLIITPSILNSTTFTSVVRMIAVMCANCPDLAITLLKNDIASTLLYLLTGSSDPISTGDVELVSRSPAELYEITCLIGELMPRLPSNGIFVIDAFLDRPQTSMQDQIQWQWRDDRGTWHSYSSIDSKMIEAAHLNSDDEISLLTLGRTYTIDFHAMQQINEDTGTTRPVQRRVNTLQSNESNQFDSTQGIEQDLGKSSQDRDARIACLKEEHGLAADFIKNLFSVLYEVYSSSAGPAVRYKCLRALLRMVYFANPELLKGVLKNHIVSSHIAGMMASNDLRIIVGSIQMAEILMQKLPELFSVHFQREGVMYQVTQLTDPNNPLCSANSPKDTTSPTGSASATTFDFQKHHHTNKSTHVTPTTGNMHMCNRMNLIMPSTSGTPVSSLNYPSTSANLIDPHKSHNESASLHNLGSASILLSTMNAPQTISQISIENMQGAGGLNVCGSSSSASVGPSHALLQNQFTKETIFTEAVTETRSGNPSHSKMADILKRKLPPKRKSQGSSRVKSKQDESSTLSTSNASQSSVLQDLISTTLGSSARSIPSTSTSRSRFSSSSSKTSSFLASLNPVRWARNQSSHSAFTKDNATNFSKSATNTTFITAGNREKTKQWIREQSLSFINRYYNQYIPCVSPHPASTVLTRLGNVIENLHGEIEDCLYALRELHDILIESDISPFEVNHSGLIKAMLNFLASDSGLVARDTRLRLFMHVFVGLPYDQSYVGPIKILSSSFNAFVTKLNACVTQLEQFPVKVHDFPAGVGGRSNTSALKFFNTHQLKCNLQRHPDCTNLRQWKGGTVKIDPLALVQAIERYLVVRGYGGIRVDSEEDSEEDIDDTVASATISQTGLKHKLQFMIDNHVLPYNMTVYQAIKQFSPLVNDHSETETDCETPIGNASIWVQQHTIYYRPIEEENQTTGGNKVSGSSSSRKSKNSLTKIFRRRNEFWVDGCAPPITSPLTKFLSSSLPVDIVTVQDASLDALCLLRIINALNRNWSNLYYSIPPQAIISQSEFIHSKITAKANRQLQDPLVIMTGNLPQWLQQLAMACPFLFPFETRHLLFYAVSFDRDRALQRLLDSAPEFNTADTSERVTPRLDKRKRLISRTDVLKQAEHIIQDYGHSKALLEIQYENEVGTGLGPTLEFYSLVSTELQRDELGLWNASDSYKRSSNNISDFIKAKSSKRFYQKSSTITNSGDATDRLSIIENEDSISLPILQSNNTSSNVVQYIHEELNVELSVNSQNEIIESNMQYQQMRSSPIIDILPNVTYVNPVYGLFPAPIGKASKFGYISKIKSKFRFLGKFMAKAVMDSRMLDLPFSIPFYRWLLTEEYSLTIHDLAYVVPEVQSTLLRLQDVVRQRDAIQMDPNLDAMKKTEKIQSLDLDGCVIADLGLDFILPGHVDIELRKGGADIPVTIHNLHQYISLVTHWFLVEGVYRQFEAIREGFESVFSSQKLAMFYPEELEHIFCGAGSLKSSKWDVRMLQDNCRTDHGFNQDSVAIQYFYDILSTYSTEEQRLFLQFVTGSPRLPTGGFKSLTPPLTIVRKTMESNQNPDEYLPSVMTCVNYLKLPEYTNRDVMETKLKLAANEGRMSFLLS